MKNLGCVEANVPAQAMSAIQQRIDTVNREVMRTVLQACVAAEQRRDEITRRRHRTPGEGGGNWECGMKGTAAR